MAASVGLMGVVADAVLAGGGKVDGVIPKMLATKELLHVGVTKCTWSKACTARKALMTELADCFIALPGGFGTFEELFEVITWGQLGLHAKPIGSVERGRVLRRSRPLPRPGDRRAIHQGKIPRAAAGRRAAERPARSARHPPPATVKKWIAPDET